MFRNEIKGLFPNELKDWIKSHPGIANLIDQLLNGKREITVFIDIPTLMSPNERAYLFQVARSNKLQNVILEIGCYAGGSTYFLGKGAELSDSFVYSIDPFDSNLERQACECDGSIYPRKPSKDEVQENMRRHGLDKRVILIEGFSPEVASKWNGYNIGILFIDGNHKQVYEDYMAWRGYLANNAVVVFHDANFPQNGRADVTQAVERIKKEDDLEVLTRIDSLISLRHKS